MSERKADRRIVKCPTGITGLDQITEGGLPMGRPTLLCGTAGAGKSVLSLEFLVRGVTEFKEPGVFMAFEETDKELSDNVASLGFDLPALCARKKLFVDYVRVERSEIEESGAYDLEGLFVRLGSAIDAVGAKRVVLDTIESLFSGFSNKNILRAEIRRLFRWLKTKGVTAVITAETGEGRLTRQGIEEYIADCVIMLDHRVENQTSIRRLRVLKYRGSSHGTNEYPFLIGHTGLSVLPLSSLKLEHKAPTQRVSTGISRLDESLGGKGFYRGASILVSGDAGTGKSSLAAHFVNAACARGERALYMTSEQSASEVIRNMHSIGIRLEPWIQRGLLRIYAARPGSFGLEQHLVTIHDITAAFSPKVVVIDPITNFPSTGAHSEVNSMVTRLIDIFKARQITGMYTSLTSAGDWSELSRVGVSSLMDTCLMLRNLECNGERNRGLHVLKSRGTAHSNQIREFVLSDHGLQLLDVYLGSSRSLTGSARVAQEAKEQMESEESKWQAAQMEFETEQEHQRLELQISKMRADFEFNERQSLRHARAMESRDKKIASNRVEMANSQRVEVVPSLSNWRARKQGAVSRFAKA